MSTNSNWPDNSSPLTMKSSKTTRVDEQCARRGSQKFTAACPSWGQPKLAQRISRQKPVKLKKHCISLIHIVNHTTEGGSPPKLFVFTNGVAVPVAVEERQVHGIWDDVNLAGNVTTVIVTNLSFNEMNSDQLIIMQRLIKTTAPLVVVEFGQFFFPLLLVVNGSIFDDDKKVTAQYSSNATDPPKPLSLLELRKDSEANNLRPQTILKKGFLGNRSNETRDLLDEAAICLLSGRIANASPNVVYFCNNAAPAMFSNLQIENLHEITPSELNNKPSDLHRPTFWPWFFVSAFDEDVDEIVDQIMEDIAEQRPVVTEPEKEPNAYQKKLGCKYRKSCYDTGVVPDIETVFTRFVKRWWPHWLETEDAEKQEDETEEDTGKPYDSEEDLLPQKVRCKYRISCYQEHGIPFDEKAEERRKVLLSSKRVVQSKGQKKTLKEIAAHTLKKVQEAEEKAAKRPVVKVVEKRLNAIEEKLSEKLNCKYRKSCYETGQKPVIADGWSLPLPIKIFSTESAEAATKEINYDELEELEKKVYCKYRKSCYETGIRPDFEPEIFVGTFRDLFTIHEQVEPRKMTMQEKCKYRKSCYETGIVPEINPKLEEAIHKEVSPVIPTNAQDLRLLCKYRKSCYAEIHDSATVDTIKFIRKRRQIEKEVRRRRAKRAKLHRRFRGELQLDSYRRHHRRDKTMEEEQPEQKEQQPEEPEEVEDFVDVKIIPPKRGRKEKVKEKREEVVEEVPVKATKFRKTKQPQKIESEEDEAIEEPVPIPCKYRKSCYAETGLSPEKEDLKDSDEKREPAKVAGQQAKQVPVSKDSREDKEGARRSIRTAQTGTGPAARTTDKETQDVESEPQTMNEDHAGSMARIGLERYRKDGWCNKYYYSCRAILGLPPKERAPIGPNGKRLCRKKPL
ncbi:hypothetical protein OSTOST_17430 [Ostertagia ostertagi]